VEQVLEAAQERLDRRYRLSASGCTFDRIVERLSEHMDVSVDNILSPAKHPQQVKARSVVAYR